MVVNIHCFSFLPTRVPLYSRLLTRKWLSSGHKFTQAAPNEALERTTPACFLFMLRKTVISRSEDLIVGLRLVLLQQA
jgi:hypothetical protein